MIELTDAARRLISDAWRHGRVLALHRPWSDLGFEVEAITGHWTDAETAVADGCLAVTEPGTPGPVYVPADLLPALRRRRPGARRRIHESGVKQ